MEQQLIGACKFGSVKTVKQLLSNNPQINLNFEDINQRTPFSLACEFGHIEIVKLLLSDNRVDVNKTNIDHKTPFYVACEFGYLEIMEILIKDKRIDVNKSQNQGATPLFVACINQNAEIINLLLNDQRVDVNIPDNKGRTPFYLVCQFGYFDTAEYMLACRKEIDLSAHNNKGNAAIDTLRDKERAGKNFWHSEEYHQILIKRCRKFIELLERFEREPNETRFEMRIKLGFAGNPNF